MVNPCQVAHVLQAELTVLGSTAMALHALLTVGPFSCARVSPGLPGAVELLGAQVAVAFEANRGSSKAALPIQLGSSQTQPLSLGCLFFLGCDGTGHSVTTSR